MIAVLVEPVSATDACVYAPDAPGLRVPGDFHCTLLVYCNACTRLVRAAARAYVRPARAAGDAGDA